MLCILLLCSAPGLSHRSDRAVFSAEDLRRLELQIHQYVNKERSLNQKPALKWNDALAAEARRHAGYLAGESSLSHIDHSGGDVGARLDQAKIGWRRCGENLYEGNIGDPAVEAVRLWLKSSGHHRNMMDAQYNETGVGAAARENGMIVIAQDFITTLQ